MSQLPPPPPPSSGPPPGGQPPMQPMGGGSVGSNKKTFTILAYVLSWIGGVIFLFVGKDDPDVKWNAANSIIVFGGLTVIRIVGGFIPFIGWLIVWVTAVAGIVYWIYFLVKSLQGNGERIPALGIAPMINSFVDQLAAAV